MRFVDIYIRPATTPLTDFSALPGGMGSLLDGWDRIDFIKRAPKITTEPTISEDYNDGTTGTAEEKLSLEFATFKTDKAHFDYLSSLKGTLLDFLLFDTADDSFITAAFGLRLHVNPVAQTSESAIINLSASRSFPSNPSLEGILLVAGLTPYGVISGTVLRPDATTPDSGVLVSVTGSTGTFTDTTDADGNYLLYVNALAAGTTFTFTLTKSGKTYPTGQTISAFQKTEVSKNFTALT